MFKIELAFFICPTFLKHLCQKNLLFGTIALSSKMFQTIVDKLFERNTFSNSLSFPQFSVSQRDENLLG